MHKVNELKPI